MIVFNRAARLAPRRDVDRPLPPIFAPQRCPASATGTQAPVRWVGSRRAAW